MRFARHVRLIMVLLATGFVIHAQPGRNLSSDQRVLTGTDWRLVSLGPTRVVAATRSGKERISAGCYVMRRSNVRDVG